MGIAKQPFSSKGHNQSLISNFDNSMSQDYHHQHQHPGIFSFVPNGFERSQQEQHEEHIAQQIRRDKLRVLQGFEATQMNPLVALGATESEGYNESGGMLSEMFNFSPGGTTATELLENQISQSYRNSRPMNMNGVGIDWYGQRQHELPVGGLGPLVDIKNPPHHHHHQISSINTNSAASMQLFLMNPPPPHRSPSPSASSHPPPPPPVTSSGSTLHMLLPNPSSNTTLQGYHNHQNGGAPFEPPQFSNWVAETHNEGRLNNPNEIGGVEGLSLSLSSSLQNFEGANKGDNGMVFFDQGTGSTSHEQFTFKNLGGHNNQQQIHVGYGSSLGIVNVLRNSKYGKAAQELLEEFCSVGRGQIKKNRNPNSNNQTATNGTCSSSSKEHHSLSASDRLEHQRRKLKLLSMLDEVEKRYNNYCEQMQMVVNSFDLVMGFGAALPYTALAQKAMSRHFRCLKDAITSQLKNSCEVLGEKDIAGTSGGLTKGETPRLKLLEQSLRQQRTFHQMGGMMEQEAWRPQRGLPERSVNILRAWLFEHFLHPYPSDADKHVLARQTGLSRNQVSNWFINARVRLWKPMVEEMYQQESKEGEETEETEERELIVNNKQQEAAQTSTPNANAGNVKTITAATADVTATTTEAIRATTGKTIENDPSLLIAINTRCVSENQAKKHSVINAESIMNATTTTSTSLAPPVMQPYSGNDDIGSTFIRFGTSSGDVSLTLGLRHTGNMPEKNSFSVRDFESF